MKTKQQTNKQYYSNVAKEKDSFLLNSTTGLILWRLLPKLYWWLVGRFDKKFQKWPEFRQENERVAKSFDYKIRMSYLVLSIHNAIMKRKYWDYHRAKSWTEKYL